MAFFGLITARMRPILFRFEVTFFIGEVKTEFLGLSFVVTKRATFFPDMLFFMFFVLRLS